VIEFGNYLSVVPHSISTINLAWNNICGEEGGKAVGFLFQCLTSLQSLSLYGNQLGNSGLRQICWALAANTTLQSLNIGDCGFDEEGIRDILSNKSITALYLNKTKFGDEGAELIANLVSSKSTLSDLSLWGCGIGETGSERICAAAKKNPHLLSLDLARNAWNEKCFELVESNTYLLSFYKDSERRAPNIGKRNLRIWKERLKWSCILNYTCRHDLRKSNVGFPPEMVYYIMMKVVPEGILTRVEMKKIGRYANDRETLGNDKMTFWVRIFGTGIKRELKKIEDKNKREEYFSRCSK